MHVTLLNHCLVKGNFCDSNYFFLLLTRIDKKRFEVFLTNNSKCPFLDLATLFSFHHWSGFKNFISVL